MGFVQLVTVACLLFAWPHTRAAPVMTLVGSSTQVSVHAVTDAATQTPTTQRVTLNAGARSDDAVTASSESSSSEATPPKATETTTHKSEAQMADEHKAVEVVATTHVPSSPAPVVSEEKAEVQADQPSPKTEESKEEEKVSEEVAKDESKEKEEPREEKTELLMVDTTPEPAKEAMEKKAEESAPVPVTEPKESESAAESKQPETTVTSSESAAAESKPTGAPLDVTSTTAHPTDMSSEAPRSEEPAVSHTAMEAHVETPVNMEKSETPVEVKPDTVAVTTPAGTLSAVEDKPQDEPVQDEPVQAESDVDEQSVEAPKDHKEAVEKSVETAVAEKATTQATTLHSSPEAHSEKTDDHVQSSTKAGDHNQVSMSSTAPSQTTADDHTEGEKVSTGTPSVAAMEAESSTVVERADALTKAALDVAKAAEEVLTSTHGPAASSTHTAEAAASSESMSSASSAASEATTVKVETSSTIETTASTV